jgi:hypothetical protein
MVYFHTKNPTLGKFLKVLQWKTLVHFMDIWSMYFTAIWYILWLSWSFGTNIFPRLGMLYREKSDNPVGYQELLFQISFNFTKLDV